MASTVADPRTIYEVIVDTDSYSGNFERQMTGYVLGVIGDCEVGNDEAQQFFDDMNLIIGKNPFDELVEQVADEHGCYRPCSISPTPGRVNTGMGQCYDADSPEGKDCKYDAYESVTMYFHKDPSHHLDLIRRRAQQFCEDNDIGFIRLRLESVKVSVDRSLIFAT